MLTKHTGNSLLFVRTYKPLLVQTAIVEVASQPGKDLFFDNDRILMRYTTEQMSDTPRKTLRFILQKIRAIFARSRTVGERIHHIDRAPSGRYKECHPAAKTLFSASTLVVQAMSEAHRHGSVIEILFHKS